MKTLRMVGIDKAKERITTLEKLLQVRAEDHSRESAQIFFLLLHTEKVRKYSPDPFP